MISYLVIVNPASGRGQARVRAEVLREVLSVVAEVTVVETEQRGSAEEITASQGPQFDRVIAVGGDGTLNEVLTGLLRTEGGPDEIPALGFLPSGTANAAIAAFGFSTDPTEVARKLPTVEVRLVDVGIVKHAGGERPFLLWCGAGYDAVLIDTLNTARTGLMGVSGLVVNSPRVLSALFTYPAPGITVSVDGKSLSTATSVILANVGEVAFGASVADTADPFDGQLDVVSVPPSSMFGLGRMGLSMLTSSLRRAKGVEHCLGTEVVLESQGDVPFQIDGEPVGELPVSVRLHPGAVRLLLT